MSFLKFLGLLAQLSNTQLAQDIKACVLNSTDWPGMWNCIESKLATAIGLTPVDQEIVNAARALARHV